MKAMPLVAISVALTLSGSHAFAKTSGSSGASQVKTSGTSAAPSGAQALAAARPDLLIVPNPPTLVSRVTLSLPAVVRIWARTAS